MISNGPKAIQLAVKVIPFWLLALATIGFLAAISFPENLKNNVLAILLVQPVVLTFVIVAALRSRVSLLVDLRLMSLVYANSMALTLSTFLPAKLGEFVKPFALARLEGIPKTRGLSMVVIERALDAATVGVIVLSAAVTGIIGFPLFGLDNSHIVAAIISVAILVFLTLVPKVRSLAREICLQIKETLGTGSRLWMSLVLTAALWVLSATMMVLFAIVSFDEPPSLSVTLLVFIASTVGIALGLTPGGLGIVEGIQVALLVANGIDLKEAVSFSIAFRLALLLIPVSVAGLGLNKLRITARDKDDT
jgi:uncharacterized membrane protein YbhN (UPF0104 family)